MIQLAEGLDQLQIQYDDQVLNKYCKYMERILEWNKMVNITSITDPEQFVEKHYLDSLLSVTCSEFKRAKRVIDIGTGGGFPGIPLALAAPDKEFLLIDSLNKRIKIINEICAEIGISNVTAIHGRAEELAKNKQYREQFDLCVSRAVANLATLAEYCIPFICKGGWFLAYKGPDTEKELAEAEKALKILGGHIQREEKASLDGFTLQHKIIFIEKTRKTPTKYPRKAGTPSKEPLI